jgi:hypothetical protein
MKMKARDRVRVFEVCFAWMKPEHNRFTGESSDDNKSNIAANRDQSDSMK